MTQPTPTPRRPRNSPEGLIEAILKQPLEVKLRIRDEIDNSILSDRDKIEQDRKELDAKLNLINKVNGK